MAKSTQLIFEILDAEKERLFQYASYRLRNIRDVEDALQNIYVRALSDPGRFGRIENKKAYLYRMLSNECTNLLREDTKAASVDIDSFAALELESLQPENFEEEFVMINSLLGMETIRLKLHSNLSFQEIADVMEVPLPTAKARYRYGIEKIRNGLKKENLL